MKFRAVLLAAATMFAALHAPAQKPGAGAGPGVSPGSRTPSLGNTTTPSNRNQGANPDMTGSSQRGIYFTGRVQMDDGSPIPMEVTIEKVCSGRRQPLGYADRKGNFGVTLQTDQAAADSEADYQGRTSGQVGSTSSKNGPTISRLTGCELQAALPGYRSDTVDIGTARSLDNPNVGTLILHHLGPHQEGGAISASMLNAPKGALKDYQRGLDDLRKTNVAAAEKNFQKAVTAYPAFAAAWFELGRLTMPTDQKLGREDYKMALNADPKFLPPYCELALAEIREKNWQSALATTDRALRMDSAGFPELFYYNAIAHFNLRQLDEAEKRAREAVKVDTEHKVPRAQLLLGYILSEKGDLQGAAEQMKAFVSLAPNAADSEKTRTQIARLEAQIAQNK